jgi:hypothetical protein
MVERWDGSNYTTGMCATELAQLLHAVGKPEAVTWQEKLRREQEEP